MIPDGDPSLRRRHQHRCPERNSTLVTKYTADAWSQNTTILYSRRW